MILQRLRQGRLPSAAAKLLPRHFAAVATKPRGWNDVWCGAALVALAAGVSFRETACEATPPVPKRPPAARRVKVARADDVAEGELKQIKVAGSPDGASEGAILLARIDGKFYATGASCSHYSAPLAQGVAAQDKMHVVCPWHNAAFDLRTGQPVRGAGFQAIPTYAVSVESGDVIVDLPKGMEDFVAPAMACRNPEDQRFFVVVGGGAAGLAAADALRQEGFTGRILLLSEEKHLPYDRPVLSKNLAKGTDPASLSLRDPEYFAQHDIEVRQNARVASLDAAAKTIRLTSGEEIRYDSAVVATGAKPRMLPIKGGDLPGVMSLRNPEDAARIAATCTSGKNTVVIGSSFIGMEIAATLKRRGCTVTVLGMEAVPFERVLGKRLGESVKALFESKGVKFMGEKVANEIKQEGDSLKATLKSGEVLTCDAIIVGVGVVPNAGFVTGAEKAKDGSLLTDECLKTSAEGLYAAGDVATYTSVHSKGQPMRVEHWDVATSQGRLVAKTMMGKRESFDQTPFFWTSLFGKNLRYVGYCMKFDELLVDGDLQKLNFVAYYCHENEVKAVATMGRDPVAVVAGELMRMGRMPSVSDFKAGKVSTSGLANELKRINAGG